MARKAQPRVSVNSQPETPTEEVFAKNNIALDELIPVISLIDYPLNLLTQQGSPRAKYRFDGFGQKKHIIYQDILTIIESYRHFMEKGFFWIADQRVIDRHGLQDVQKSILTKESLDKILSGSKESPAIYKSASEEQKRMIVGMMIRKLTSDPQSIDLNVVDEISRLSKTNIQQTAEEARQLYSREEKTE